MGHWEGDTLVVDTIGMREESWLTTEGLQHSDKMHMVERFTKTSPDTFILKVTIDDPVYFTKPFTYGVTHRAGSQSGSYPNAAMILPSTKNTP